MLAVFDINSGKSVYCYLVVVTLSVVRFDLRQGQYFLVVIL